MEANISQKKHLWYICLYFRWHIGDEWKSLCEGWEPFHISIQIFSTLKTCKQHGDDGE